MALASVQGSWPKRFMALGLGVVVVGALILVSALDQTALAKAPPKADPAKPAPKADLAKPATTKPDNYKSGEGLNQQDAEVVKIIDDKLAEAWKANNVKQADRCTDYEFVRRVSLDLIGRIARPDEITRFINHPASTRRAQLVEELLKSEEYAKNWAHIWTSWLLTRSGAFGRGKYHDQMVFWLEEQFALNKSYDKIVTELITAKGNGKDNGAVNFIAAHVGETIPAAKAAEEGRFEMAPITSRVTRLFLGVQTQCTQCHDHPFDSRKQSEFWGVNAFLRQIERRGNPMPRRGALPDDMVVDVSPNLNKPGTVFYEKRNGVVLETGAVFLDGKKVTPGIKDRREDLAKYLVDHEMFTKSFANRMWAHFFGRGFCNPIDDFNSQNQVNHPELLQELGDKFKHYGYDQKRVMKWICNSRAYNLKSTTNSTNDKPEHEVLFCRMVQKAMSPEQLFESLMTATSIPLDIKNAEAVKTKKAQREAWMGKLVSNFGDDEGNEVNFNGTVVQALMLMNGDDINKAISDEKNGNVAAMVKRRGAINYNINHLFLVALNRPAEPKETADITKALSLAKPRLDKPNAAYYDLLWAMLNSAEFALNH